MHYDPKCNKKRHSCQNVCISEKCSTDNPFVCEPCGNPHSKQTCEVMPYKKVVRQFHKIQGLYTKEVINFEAKVESIFDELLTNLKAEFIKFREQFEYTYANEHIMKIYDNIKAHTENDLSAEDINKALRSKRSMGVILKVKDDLDIRMCRTELMQIYDELIAKLPKLYTLKNLQFQDADTSVLNPIKFAEDNYMRKRKQTTGLMNQHFKYLQELLNQDIYNIQLLYRASDHQFSAREFHRSCDGHSNTITIAQTEHNRVVLGFCSFPWQSPNQWVYREDRKMECFLASTTQELRGRRFTVAKPKFAIGMHKDYGPSFGDDFVIYDKAQHSKNCWSNFPDVYNCKTRPVVHGGESIKQFVGTDDHYQKFNLIQWQVYKLCQSKEQQLETKQMRQYKAIPI